MIRRRARATRTAAVAAALLITLGVGTAATGAPAAHADTSLLPVRLTVDALSPAIPRAGDTLRVSGRLQSTGLESFTDVTVRLRRGRTPITTRTDLTDALAAPESSTEPDSVPVAGSTDTVAATLAPGSSAPFSLTVPMSALHLSAAGAWVIGVEVTGAAGGGAPVRIGEVRTVVPYFPASPQPIDVTWLWPVVDWPARTANGVLLDDRTPQELAPGGRLAALVDAASHEPSSVSWVLDPALLQTARDMSDGYQVLTSGAPTVGAHPEQAEDWLRRLTTATKSAPTRVLPYADVDTSALVRAGLTADVVRAVTQGPVVGADVLGHPVTGGLAWSPYGRIDAAAADVLTAAGIGAIVLPADALPTTDPASTATTSIATAHGSLRAVLTDPHLSALIDATSPSDPVLLRQEFLTDTALIAAGMSTLRADRGLVIAPRSVTWSASAEALAPLVRALSTTPWLRARSLDDLLALPPDSALRGRAPYGARARASELAQDYLTRVARTSSQVATMTAVLADPAGMAEPFLAALLRAESSTWRTDPARAAQLLATISRSVSAQTALVHVLSEGTITLSGDAGRVPVTIANDSDRTVTVGVELQGNPAIRLRSQPLTGIRIAPGQKASVDLRAQVIGADSVPVDVQLLTPDGVDYGTPARISVTSTAYARAASWVVIAAFAAIVIFVVVGITRRIRAARRREATGASGTDGTEGARE